MSPSERDALCREYAAALREESARPEERGPLASVAETLPPLPGAPLAVGQLWRVTSETTPDQALVALTRIGSEARGVLASIDTWMASAEDIIVAPRDSPTRQPMTLHPWCEHALGAVRLTSLIGAFPALIVEPLLLLVRRRISGGVRMRAVEVLPGDGDSAIRWTLSVIDSDGPVHSFLSGSRIVDPSDGRETVRAALRGSTQWLAGKKLSVIERLVARWRAAVSALEDAIQIEPEGDLAHAALRHPVTTEDTASVSFSLLLGETRAEIRVVLSPDVFEIVVSAVEKDRPRRGILVELRIVGPNGTRKLNARTDRHGIAALRDDQVAPDAEVELTLGSSEVRRVVTVK